VHPLALCESEEIGPRTRVWAFAHVMVGAVLGADCKVGGHAFLEGGAVVGNRVNQSLACACGRSYQPDASSTGLELVSRP
jgi:UDP-3-O-[3-hydroxymyristoyl] glucosamine N-acyltransferase